MERDRYVQILVLLGFNYAGAELDGSAGRQRWALDAERTISVRNAAVIGDEWALRELRRCMVPEERIARALRGDLY